MKTMHAYVAMAPYQGADRPFAVAHTLAGAQATCERAESRHRDPRNPVEHRWVEREGQLGSRVWALATRYRFRHSAGAGWGRWSEWDDAYYYVHEVPVVEEVESDGQ